MKLSDGVEWGLHCAVLLAVVPPDRALTTQRLAEYHGVPAAYLAKHLQAMSRAGILDSVQGPRGGYRLARPAGEITTLDVLEAIDGTESAFACTEIRRRGPTAAPASAYRVPCRIHALMDRADDAWRAELRATSIEDLVVGVAEHADPRVLEKAGKWFEEVLP